MSLWVDKYRPNALDKLDYHPDVTDQLRKLVRGRLAGRLDVRRYPHPHPIPPHRPIPHPAVN